MLNMANNDVVDADDGEKLGRAILADDAELKVIDIEWDADEPEEPEEDEEEESNFFPSDIILLVWF